ncbi:MAG: hypothetical protein V2I41_00575 [Pseudomonadales bacterium]|nr:hypothetical protein [Pseudomonadales bacterium]
MPYSVTEVMNQDVAGLAERADEVIYEIAKSQSANLTDMRPFDRTRISEYNLMLNRYAAWVTDAPDIDLPETHPRSYPIKYISSDTDADVENKAIRDLIRMYRALITEMTNSQSARAANGLTVHDKRRFDLVMEKIGKFLADYVDETQPIDMPESAPSSDGVSQGYVGAA